MQIYKITGRRKDYRNLEKGGASMAIGQIEIQGQITRAQDFTFLKHNEDTRGTVEQANAGEQVAKQAEEQVNKVKQKQQPENQNKKHDAKEKGSNEYTGDGGRNRNREKKEPKEPDGKVLLKGIVD